MFKSKEHGNASHSGEKEFRASKRQTEITREIKMAEPGIKSAGNSENPEGLDKHEDKFRVEDGISIICDGAGGYKGAEVAASLAVEAVFDKLKDHKGTPSMSAKDAEKLMSDAIKEANAKILRMKELPGYEDMGTTVSATMLYWDTDTGKVRAAIGQVGDSHIYLHRGNDLKRISPEDSVLGEMEQLGVDIDTDNILEGWTLGGALEELREEDLKIEQATRSGGEITAHRNKVENLISYFDKKIDPRSGKRMTELDLKQLKNMMTRALGEENIEPHILSSGPLKEGDLLVSCSDALTDNNTRKQITDEINTVAELDPAEASAVLTDFAVKSMNENNSMFNKKDNATVTVTKINKLELPEEIELSDKDIEEVEEEEDVPDLTEYLDSDASDFDIDIVIEDSEESIEDEEEVKKRIAS